MNKLLLIFTLLFTVLLSDPSYAEWTKLGKVRDGHFYYVDFERIRKHDGYVYYWELLDRLKPTNSGVLSSKGYLQGDCNLFRHKYLSFVHHKQPMGRDVGESNSPKNPEWKYPPPNSSAENILKSVCNHVK